MWSVKDSSKCLQDGEWCGQACCPRCEMLAEAWDENAKGHWKERLTWRMPPGEAGCRHVKDGWKEPNGEEVGGFWEWNWRRVQQARIQNKLKQQELKREMQINIGAGLKHVLWTISLTENYDLKLMQKQLDTLILNDKYQMGQSLAAVEFHSENHPEGGNLHIHIVVINHGTLKPCDKKVWIAKWFGIEENFIDYQTRRPATDFEHAINYVLGDKSSLEKQGYVEKDRQWRQLNNLPQLTSSLPKDIWDRYVKPQLWYT